MNSPLDRLKEFRAVSPIHKTLDLIMLSVKTVILEKSGCIYYVKTMRNMIEE